MNKTTNVGLQQLKTSKKSLNKQLTNHKQVDKHSLDKYRFINTSRKHSKTQYNQEIQVRSKNSQYTGNNDFSEEYLMLVNRLKFNLSKKKVSKKKSAQIVLEKQSLYIKQYKYNLQKRPQTDLFSQKNHNKSYSISQVTKRLNFDMKPIKIQLPKNDQENKHYKFTHLSDQTQVKPIIRVNARQESGKKLRLYSEDRKQSRYAKDNTLQSKINGKMPNLLPSLQQNSIKQKLKKANILQEIQQKQKDLQNLKKKLNQNIKSTKNYLRTISQQQQKKKKSKQFHNMRPIQKSINNEQLSNQNGMQQIIQINKDYHYLDQLCLHLKIVIDISQAINNIKNDKENNYSLSVLLKTYVLGARHFIDNQTVLTDSIAHLQELYKKQEHKIMLKRMVLYERIVIIYTIDLIFNHQIDKYINEIQQILHSIIGIYLYYMYTFQQIKTKLSQFSQQSLKHIKNKVTQSNIHIKKQLYCNNIFITKKLQSIFKSNKVIAQQMTILIIQFQKRNVSINRSFYQLLKLYAIHLNNNDSVIEKHYNCLKTFATCPSPYLIKQNIKEYSLVLDLDETLIHTCNTMYKLQIFLRPYLKEFLSVMSKDYQIIIFTSSMPQYSQPIINQLPFVDHKLFRYHATRLKNRHIKDLSRLGRSLSRTIIIDNDEQNFALQKQNGIHISQWNGLNKSDQELNIIGLFLKKIIENKIEDVRQYVQTFQQFRKRYP